MAHAVVDRQASIARYKALLREYINQRPSGLRQRLATALGKHKSFISQITNPNYRVPVPASDVETILDVCRLTPEEKWQFLEAYKQAHLVDILPNATRNGAAYEIKISLPPLSDPDAAKELEDLIRDFATRVIRLALKAEKSGDVDNR